MRIILKVFFLKILSSRGGLWLVFNFGEIHNLFMSFKRMSNSRWMSILHGTTFVMFQYTNEMRIQ